MEILIVSLIGLMCGSFVTMASYRLPLGKDWIVQRSHCTHCQHALGVKDLFPVISWLMHKGRCAYCHVSVSARYPLIELAVMGMFLLAFLRYGITLQTLLLWLFAVAIMIMIVTDFEHYIIPDSIQLMLLGIGIAYTAFQENPPFLDHSITAVSGFALGLLLQWSFRKWKKREALGFGDVKFLAVAGMLIGSQAYPAFLFIAGIAGILTAIVWRMLGRGELFPFGPALALSLFICINIPEIPALFTVSGESLPSFSN